MFFFIFRENKGIAALYFFAKILQLVDLILDSHEWYGLTLAAKLYWVDLSELWKVELVDKIEVIVLIVSYLEDAILANNDNIIKFIVIEAIDYILKI